MGFGLCTLWTVYSDCLGLLMEKTAEKKEKQRKKNCKFFKLTRCFTQSCKKCLKRERPEADSGEHVWVSLRRKGWAKQWLFFCTNVILIFSHNLEKDYSENRGGLKGVVWGQRITDCSLTLCQSLQPSFLTAVDYFNRSIYHCRSFCDFSGLRSMNCYNIWGKWRLTHNTDI